MGNFYTDVIQPSIVFDSVVRVSSLDYLEPNFRAVVEQIVVESAAAGTPLLVFETYRSEARQQQLFDEGTTQLSQVGVHHYGLACDLVKDVNGEPSWDGDYSFLGALANKHGMVWGGSGAGNLNIGDNDHIQWCSFTDQTYLFDGSWYPVAGYVAWPPQLTVRGHSTNHKHEA